MALEHGRDCANAAAARLLADRALRHAGVSEAMQQEVKAVGARLDALEGALGEKAAAADVKAVQDGVGKLRSQQDATLQDVGAAVEALAAVRADVAHVEAGAAKRGAEAANGAAGLRTELEQAMCASAHAIAPRLSLLLASRGEHPCPLLHPMLLMLAAARRGGAAVALAGYVAALTGARAGAARRCAHICRTWRPAASRTSRARSRSCSRHSRPRTSAPRCAGFAARRTQTLKHHAAPRMADGASRCPDGRRLAAATSDEHRCLTRAVTMPQSSRLDAPASSGRTAPVGGLLVRQRT